MTFTYFFLLGLSESFILDMEECVSVILLQLILLPFSRNVTLESPYVDLSTIIPLFPLSIVSPLFVYLS